MNKFGATIKHSNPTWTRQATAQMDEAVSIGVLEAARRGEGISKQIITRLDAVDTGKMRAAMEHDRINKKTARYYNETEYFPFINWGTYRMAPIPILKPSVIELKKSIKSIFSTFIMAYLRMIHG